MQMTVIGNRSFEIAVNSYHGSVERLILRNDPERMNWVLDPVENRWHAGSLGWGLGYLNLGRKHKIHTGLARWEAPDELTGDETSCRITYAHPLFRVEVEREFLEDDSYCERYRFVNVTDDDLEIENLAVYTPFNDNYPDSTLCAKRRCHAHVWCGGDTAWVQALRMGGAPPHLGFVVTQGSFKGYEISERRLAGNNSNVRGTIGLLADVERIPAGEHHQIEWRLFPFDDPKVFKNIARGIAQAPFPEAETYTVQDGEPFSLRIPDAARLPNLRISVKSEEIKHEIHDDGTAIAEWAPPGPGQHTVSVEGNGKNTFLKVQAISDPMRIIENRARFIIEKQQVRDKDSELDGAFLIYDNETRTTFRGKLDYNEGRERIGMGVLIAMLHRIKPCAEYADALLRYRAFVRERLQKPDGTVLNGVRDEHCRPYNFPLVAWFHLEMHRAFGNPEYLVDAVDALRAFYRTGHNFYAIDIQVVRTLEALVEANMRQEHRELLDHFVKQGDFMLKNGVAYPPHEVVFEQSIVGPATQFLYELYLVTREERYRDAALPHLRCLEMFNGDQPDFHLNDIAIRHWDGWWFGKRPRWGDTMPHYWSTITAMAFHRCWLATGMRNYLERAKRILLGNFCLFSEDGRGSCAYLYPQMIDGEPGGYYDPYANDQDWALVHYLDIAPDLGHDCRTT